jgi:RimJ/RimL family protein N-acetyltransferase
MDPLDLRIETERLILRPPAPADADDLARWLVEDDIARWTANIPHPYSRADAEKWIADARHAMRDVRALAFVIERRDEPGAIGAVGVALDGPGKEGDIGWWVAIPHQGQGYASEAASRVIELCFAMDVVRLTAGALPDNFPSLAIARKLGMRPAGKLMRAQPARGSPRETLEFVLTR